MQSANKSELRRSGLRARRSLTPAERDQWSLAISSQLDTAPGFLRARQIGCYLPFPDEVSPWALIERAWRMKKRVFVPVIDKKRRMRFRRIRPGTPVARSSFGILEPTEGEFIDESRLDLVFVPLVAFDSAGHRIGMGGGYYDRTFAPQRWRNLWLRPRLIGLAFSCQQAPAISASHWDIPLFQIYTEIGPAVSVTS